MWKGLREPGQDKCLHKGIAVGTSPSVGTGRVRGLLNSWHYLQQVLKLHFSEVKEQTLIDMGYSSRDGN